LRILLVTPTFHGYGRSIEFGFESLGHTVHRVDYDELSTVTSKVMRKARIDMPERLGLDRTSVLSRAISKSVALSASEMHPDVVIVIKGDILDPELWEKLRAKGIPVVLWLYDELRRTRLDVENLVLFSAVATYSPHDCASFSAAGIKAEVVPLAFDEQIVAPDRRRVGGDLIFVGARYDNRARFLAELVRRGVPVGAYGRDWSHRMRDRARTLSWWRPGVPGYPDVTREEAAVLMHEGIAVLNIHGDQDGFNMRTFEACGVGALQLIDRSEVSAFYEPDTEVLVFREIDEVMEAVERATVDVAWANRIREAGRARTLAEHTFTKRCSQLLTLC